MKLRDVTFALLACAAGLVGAAFAQENDRMGESCDWLKKSGIKFTGPGGDYSLKVSLDAAGTIFWNGEELPHRKALMDRVADQKKQAKDFPATLIEAHVQTHRSSVQPVFRIFNDAKVNPACTVSKLVAAPPPTAVASPAEPAAPAEPSALATPAEPVAPAEPAAPATPG